MQFWIIGYHVFLREAIGLFVDDSDKTELPVSSNKLPRVEAAHGTRSL